MAASGYSARSGHGAAAALSRSASVGYASPYAPPMQLMPSGIAHHPMMVPSRAGSTASGYHNHLHGY